MLRLITVAVATCVLSAIGILAGISWLPAEEAKPQVAVSIPSVCVYAMPAQAKNPTSYRSEVLMPDERGHHAAFAWIDRKRIMLIVDTGATYVTLRNETAAFLGLISADTKYDQPSNTANGVAYFAAITIKQMSIGGIVLENVEARIAQPDKMKSGNLLGMSFLRRLKWEHAENESFTITQALFR